MEDCKIKILLEDKPGALSKVLDIVAKNRGNLLSVSHIREKMHEGRLPVIISFESESADFSKLLSDLEKEGIQIQERIIGGMEEAQLARDFILIGHVIDTDIKDTIYSICNGTVMIKSLDISLKSLKEPSSAFAEIGAKNSQDLDRAIVKLKELAKKKDLLVITDIQT
jgi:ACT domain-containing protein